MMKLRTHMIEFLDMIKGLPKKWQTYAILVVMYIGMSGYTKQIQDHEARIVAVENTIRDSTLADSVNRIIMDVRLRKLEVWACFSNRHAALLAGMSCPEK